MNVNINTVLAWKIVNYNIIDGKLTMPRTDSDSEIEEKGFLIDKEGCNLMDIVTAIFPDLTTNNFHYVLYKYLRPEIVTQHPQLLGCANVGEAKSIFAELIEIKDGYQYKFHDFLFQ